jgi:hypothetical protein
VEFKLSQYRAFSDSRIASPANSSKVKVVLKGKVGELCSEKSVASETAIVGVCSGESAKRARVVTRRLEVAQLTNGLNSHMFDAERSDEILAEVLSFFTSSKLNRRNFPGGTSRMSGP